MAYSVSSKGQVTLPIEVRKRLGIKAGDKVDFPVKDGAVTVVPVHSRRKSFEDSIGAYPAFTSRQEILDWVSEMRDDDARRDDLQQIDEWMKTRKP